MANPPKPSLKLIAERAGVSIMTVSRILRNYPNHNSETRTRVLKIAEELHYKKNPLISALMANIRHKKPINFRAAIGLIQSDAPGDFPDSFQANLRKGIFDSAADNGFEVEVFSLKRPGMTPQRLFKVLQARGYPGLIFEPFLQANVSFHGDLGSFAGITITNPLTQPGYNSIEPDFHRGLLMTEAKLRQKGYERIGFIPRDISESLDRSHRLSAFLFTELARPKRNSVPILWEDSDPAKMKQKLNQWIQKNEPDVVISTIQIIPEYLKELGYKIPDDLGFVNLDLIENSGHQAGINSNWYEVGSMAASQVIESIVSNNFGPVQQPKVTLAAPIWVEGESLPKKFTSDKVSA